MPPIVSRLDVTALFCDVDDFCQQFEQVWLFKPQVGWGKSSTGWTFGFKLHLVINDKGERLAFKLTPANTNDRKPVPEMTQGLFGQLFGVAKLFPVGVIGATSRNHCLSNSTIAACNG